MFVSVHESTTNQTMEKLKFIDLFCGIGGFHIGMEEASKENNLEAECVFASDIDESCQDKIELHSYAYDS